MSEGDIYENPAIKFDLGAGRDSPDPVTLQNYLVSLRVSHRSLAHCVDVVVIVVVYVVLSLTVVLVVVMVVFWLVLESRCGVGVERGMDDNSEVGIDTVVSVSTVVVYIVYMIVIL